MLAREKLLRKALLGILLLKLFAVGMDLNPCLTIFILCGIGGYVLYPARVFIPRFLAGTFSYASVLLLLRLTSDIQEIPSAFVWLRSPAACCLRLSFSSSHNNFQVPAAFGAHCASCSASSFFFRPHSSGRMVYIRMPS